MSTTEMSGMPYSISLEIGFPYMITVNINVDDALVNGIIGVLKFIEYEVSEDPVQNNIQNISNILNEHNYSQCIVDVPTDHSQLQRVPLQRGSQIVRLWIEFPSENIGKMARIKVKPLVLSKFSQNLPEALKWTPISRAKSSISLTKTIKCKRVQFQLVPAAAITIHKAQGATFNEIVYDYDKCQQNQLVYVALSRVTSLDGLYLTNKSDDFNFHHASGSQAPTVKEVKDEYLRLEQHHLCTITKKALTFLQQNDNPHTLVSLINAQSLHAHFSDIETDNVLIQSDYLALTETWMTANSEVSINNFEFISIKKTDRQPNTEPSTSREALVRGRSAGGVAIYRRTNIESKAYEICLPGITLDSSIGDMCFAEIKLDSKVLCHLGCVYIHPNTSLGRIKEYLSSQLLKYSVENTSMDINIDIETPLLIVGDFNLDARHNENFLNFMKASFNLTYTPNNEPTTIGGTNIDLTFTRNLTVELLNFIAYFSYHRPILCKIRNPD